MPDLREEILARLVGVAQSVPGVPHIFRNRAGISEATRPAIIVLDADEAVEDEELAGGRPGRAPQIVIMTPEVFVLVSKRAADIGAELNMLRRRILRLHRQGRRVPEDLHAEIVRLNFVARPSGYDATKRALADTLRVVPWWDPSETATSASTTRTRCSRRAPSSGTSTASRTS